MDYYGQKYRRDRVEQEILRFIQGKRLQFRLKVKYLRYMYIENWLINIHGDIFWPQFVHKLKQEVISMHMQQLDNQH